MMASSVFSTSWATALRLGVEYSPMRAEGLIVASLQTPPSS